MSNFPTYVHRARKAWPDAAWIIGDGRYASVARCGTLSVMLFRTPAEATQAQEFINTHGCGGDCLVDHRIVDPSPAHEVVDLRSEPFDLHEAAR